MASIGQTIGQKLVATLVALTAFVAVPLLSSVAPAGAHEMPCPRMAAMDSMANHGNDAMHTAPTPDHHMADMGHAGPGDGDGTADMSMADCSFVCKANCLHAVTAILMPDIDPVPTAVHQPAEGTTPHSLTPRAVGFTTPPPRI